MCTQGFCFASFHPCLCLARAKAKAGQSAALGRKVPCLYWLLSLGIIPSTASDKAPGKLSVHRQTLPTGESQCGTRSSSRRALSPQPASRPFPCWPLGRAARAGPGAITRAAQSRSCQPAAPHAGGSLPIRAVPVPGYPRLLVVSARSDEMLY